MSRLPSFISRIPFIGRKGRKSGNSATPGPAGAPEPAPAPMERPGDEKDAKTLRRKDRKQAVTREEPKEASPRETAGEQHSEERWIKRRGKQLVRLFSIFRRKRDQPADGDGKLPGKEAQEPPRSGRTRPGNGRA